MNHSLLITTALLSALVLSACDKKETVVVPPTASMPDASKPADTPASATTIVVPVPGPTGPAGPVGAPGEMGKPGEPGATTVIIPPAEEKK